MIKSQGFTLIELMIVVAIIGILSMFALPAYQDYVRKTQLAESIAATSGVRTTLLEHYLVMGSYDDAFLATAFGGQKDLSLPGFSVNITAKTAELGGFPHLRKLDVDLITQSTGGMNTPSGLYDIQDVGNAVREAESIRHKEAGTITYYFDSKFDSYGQNPQLQMAFDIQSGSVRFTCKKSSFKEGIGRKLLNSNCANDITAQSGWESL